MSLSLLLLRLLLMAHADYHSPISAPPPLDFFYSLRKIKTNSKGLGVSTASIATLLVGIPALHLALLGSAFATARAFGLTRPQQVRCFL
jgi:hypothetical protein